MKAYYLYHFQNIYGTERTVKHIGLELLQVDNDDDGYEVWRCETIESISEMTGWPSVYQLAVF